MKKEDGDQRKRFTIAVLVIIITFSIAGSLFFEGATTKSPVIEEHAVMVIRVKFVDTEFSLSKSEIEQLTLDLDTYYRENSWGKARIQAFMPENVTELPYMNTEYNVANWTSPSKEFDRLALDTLQHADEEINFNLYPHIILIYAGKVNARVVTGLGFKADEEVTVDRAVLVGESSMNLAILAHEFGHSLDLPDLYPYQSVQGRSDGVSGTGYVGPWCIMADVSAPIDLMAQCRMALGWLPPKTILQVTPGWDRVVELAPLEAPSEKPHVLRIKVSATQYYLVEARVKEGFGEHLPSEGVLITYVDTSLAPVEGGVKVMNSANNTLRNAALRMGVFMDRKHGFAIIVLGRNEDFFKIHFSTAKIGEVALRAAKEITGAEEAIRSIDPKAFFDAIEKVQPTIASAYSAYKAMNYAEALILAQEAKDTALSFTLPSTK